MPSPMAGTSGERYAVVSCHVEQPLDDSVWSLFSTLQERRPGGFPVAALLRPADASFGEDEDRWLARAQEAATRGPLGHHTHWTAPDHARPTGDRAGERVLAESARLHELGLRPTVFCGGGWYTDADVAEACAELGYVDCTPRATRPRYLPAGAPWASASRPVRVRVPSGRTVLAIPTTHSLGDLVRDLPPSGSLSRVVHVYFHDTDLLDRRRRALVRALLALLARRARPADLDSLARDVSGTAPEVSLTDVLRET